MSHISELNNQITAARTIVSILQHRAAEAHKDWIAGTIELDDSAEQLSQAITIMKQCDAENIYANDRLEDLNQIANRSLKVMNEGDAMLKSLIEIHEFEVSKSIAAELKD